MGISTSPRRFSLLFFSLLSASMPSSSALLLGHFTDTVSGTLSPPPQVGTASDLHLLAVPPLLVHTFDLQQQTLHHLGQELAGDVLACVQQTFSCFRHRRMLATDAC